MCFKVDISEISAVTDFNVPWTTEQTANCIVSAIYCSGDMDFTIVGTIYQLCKSIASSSNAPSPTISCSYFTIITAIGHLASDIANNTCCIRSFDRHIGTIYTIPCTTTTTAYAINNTCTSNTATYNFYILKRDTTARTRHSGNIFSANYLNIVHLQIFDRCRCT